MRLLRRCRVLYWGGEGRFRTDHVDGRVGKLELFPFRVSTIHWSNRTVLQSQLIVSPFQQITVGDGNIYRSRSGPSPTRPETDLNTTFCQDSSVGYLWRLSTFSGGDTSLQTKTTKKGDHDGEGLRCFRFRSGERWRIGRSVNFRPWIRIDSKGRDPDESPESR